MSAVADRTRDDARPKTVRALLHLLAGPIFWSLHFGTVYFAQSMLCAHGLFGIRIAGFGIVPLVVVLATILALAVLALAAIWPGPARIGPDDFWWTDADARFTRSAMLALALLAALGIVWAGATAFVVPDCPPLR